MSAEARRWWRSNDDDDDEDESVSKDSTIEKPFKVSISYSNDRTLLFQFYFVVKVFVSASLGLAGLVGASFFHFGSQIKTKKRRGNKKKKKKKKQVDEWSWRASETTTETTTKTTDRQWHKSFKLDLHTLRRKNNNNKADGQGKKDLSFLVSTSSRSFGIVVVRLPFSYLNFSLAALLLFLVLKWPLVC